MSSKERDEYIKTFKDKLQNERKRKEEDKRRDQEIQLNVELCKLRRKQIILFHKLQCEIDVMVSEYLLIFSNY
jgi:hypothetical protein